MRLSIKLEGIWRQKGEVTNDAYKTKGLGRAVHGLATVAVD